ncbi:Aspartic proteinase nepenthesin-2 [Bienertia sinuspersici]
MMRRFAAAILLLLFSLLTSTFPSSSAVNSTSITLNHGRSSLLFPLSLSRRIPNGKLRRHLQAKRIPLNARMNLFDDLLSNGYYTTRLYIGTPSQEFALIVDTGSTVTYVPCSNLIRPKVQPDQSTTYHPVKCNPDCTCDGENEQCIYERQYAEMSSSSGVLGEDIVHLATRVTLNLSGAVLAVKMRKLVIFTVSMLMVLWVWVECHPPLTWSSAILTPIAFLDSNSPYYNIELKELHVAGEKAAYKSEGFDGKHGTVLDSGTTYAYLPEPAFVAFIHAITNELHGLKQIRGPDPNYNDVCFSERFQNFPKSFPVVDMVFESGQKYSLSPENYLFKHSKVPGAYCLGVFQNGKDPTTLLGGIIVRNTLVTYDREHLKVGFWKTNCSELWEKLRVSDISPAPAPAPEPSNGEVSAPGMSPAAAPMRVPSFAIPGDKEVGFITFDMSLNIKDSDLRPRTSELSGLIAKELGVNLLNLTSSGNGSLITWGIYPDKSAKYISNATAMHIIDHLVEHNVQLPDTFGSYKLVNWKIEPPMKRSWWQQHYLLVVMAVILTLMLGLSVYGIWFILKWRQQTTIPYKPVDSDNVVLEQELQPL